MSVTRSLILITLSLLLFSTPVLATTCFVTQRVDININTSEAIYGVDPDAEFCVELNKTIRVDSISWYDGRGTQVQGFWPICLPVGATLTVPLTGQPSCVGGCYPAILWMCLL